MRNLALMWVLAGVALVSVSLYVHSETIDSADVDFCFSRSLGEQRPLLFVNNNKKNRNVKVRITTKGLSEHCWLDVVVGIDFIDESGKRIRFSREYWSGVGSYMLEAWTSFDGIGDPQSGTVDHGFVMPSEEELRFSITYIEPVQGYKKEDILKVWPLIKDKNKIFTVDMTVIPECLNTTYKFNFRGQITGECGCDSLDEQKLMGRVERALRGCK